MSAAYSIIKKAHSKGLKFLGAGCYSAVFQTKDPDTVIKIGADIFDPYLYYIRSVDGKQNKHYPKVKKLYVDNENEFFVAHLERLYDMPKEKHPDYQRIFDWAVNDKPKPEWSDESLDEAVNTLIDLVDFRSYEDVAHAEAEYGRWDIPDDFCKLDLHESNVMCRADGTIVFADPFCNYKMYDVPAVEEWAEQELGVFDAV